MKILQFTPNPLINKPGPNRTGGAAASGPDFASALKTAARRSQSVSDGPGGVISLENQRATQLPPPGDLGQAGRLLVHLDKDIRASTPEALNNLHNLEGLVYVYSGR